MPRRNGPSEMGSRASSESSNRSGGMNGNLFQGVDSQEQYAAYPAAGLQFATYAQPPQVSSSSSQDQQDQGQIIDPYDSRLRASKNAEACARYREKRKRQATDLADRNRMLERERTLLLSRIAELQSEVQFLRGGGELDLTKENELLRAEVENHKKLVKDVVFAAKRADEISIQEKTRMLYGVIESAVGQALGLAYTSGNAERGWQQGSDVLMDGGYLKMFYQYLPLGSPKEDAHRLNLRFVPRDPLQVSLRDMQTATLRSWSDPQLLSTVFDKFATQVECDRKVESLSTGIREDQGNRGVTLVRVTGSEKGSGKEDYELIYATGYKMITIYPAALLGQAEAAEAGICSNTAVDGIVVVQTTSSQLNMFVSEEFEKGFEDTGAALDLDSIDDSSEAPGSTKSSANITTASKSSPENNSLNGAPDEFRSPLLLASISWAHESMPNCMRTLVIKSFPIGDTTFRSLTGRACPAVDDGGVLDPHFAKEMEERYVRGFHPPGK